MKEADTEAGDEGVSEVTVNQIDSQLKYSFSHNASKSKGKEGLGTKSELTDLHFAL